MIALGQQVEVLLPSGGTAIGTIIKRHKDGSVILRTAQGDWVAEAIMIFKAVSVPKESKHGNK
jgi:hypothetical protein